MSSLAVSPIAAPSIAAAAPAPANINPRPPRVVEGHLSKIKDWAISTPPFARAWLENPFTQGTPIPLSPYAAQEMLKSFIPEGKEPCHFLEAGAGTGAITAQAVKILGPKDTLTLVELDPKLCGVLIARFGNDKRVKVYNSAIQDWKPLAGEPQKYDGLLSSIPFNSLPSTEALPSAELLKDILGAYVRLVKDGKPFAHANYVGTSTLCRTGLSMLSTRSSILSVVSCGEKRAKAKAGLVKAKAEFDNFVAMTKVWKDFRSQHQLQETMVKMNAPFAWVNAGTLKAKTE